MDPTKWGPHLWFYLHTISLNYPENPNFHTKTNFLEFFNALKNTIPCEKCKNHYSSYLLTNPPRLNSRKELIMWTIDLHNMVNQSLGKKIYTYEEALTLYKNHYSNQFTELSHIEYSTNVQDSNNKFIKVVQITIIVLIIIYCLYYLVNCRKIRTKKFVRI